jgi:hypothetical protein
MVTNALKTVVEAGLLMIGMALPNPRYGTVIALGTIIAAAVVLHFVAP